MKKVSIDEIKNIVEIMKYRVIGTETTPEDLKDILGFKEFLNYSKESGVNDSQVSDS